MPPIAKIGEAGWKDSLQDYLQNYEIDCQGVDLGVIEAQEKKLDIKLPEVIREYYLNFGNTDSSDFMYGLKKDRRIDIAICGQYNVRAFALQNV